MQIFTGILAELKEFNQNDKIGAIFQKLNKALTTNEDKVQFCMLLLILTLANRLALAIGSIALEKQRNALDFHDKFSFESFVLAYKDLDKAFPVPVDIRVTDYYYL